MAIDRSTSASSPYQIILPNAIELSHNKVEQKAIFLETSNDVSVFFEDFAQFSADSSAVIPVHKLGTYHIVVTMPPDSRKSQIAVASLENNTEITIRFKMAVNIPLNIDGNIFRDGDIFNLRLNKFETFQVGHTTDLTGTLVNSSAPIAVFSGDECTKLMSRGACDHLVEQVPPFLNLDNVFIVPSHAEDRTTVIRVTAGKDTNFTYTVNSIATDLTLLTGNSHEISIYSNQICLIQSEGPILVTSVSVASTTTTNGDPYMTIVPGIHQFIDYYKVPIPYNYNTNYVSITINSSAVSNILTNGTSVLQSNIVYESSSNSENGNFTVLTLSVIPGELRIHTSDHTPFGLLIYGHGRYVGYGFSGNTLLQDEE
ncbi:IgGFc-binding protein-like [Saccostrea echinata]|uniref:IgGFc-binding protein-like n=1 Tax=Saccostrea echinata TaxID=191078 RepID=UPI002A8109FD|nr:IgGFc-binding protein-like [Saccostrea echinata]